METTVDAVVSEDRSVRVDGLPFEPGTPVRLTIHSAAPQDRMEEWRAYVTKAYGSVQDPTFEVPPSSPSSAVEPIF